MTRANPRASIRRISGLFTVRELEAKPSFARVSRARGAKRQGIKYEREFALALGHRARHGVWIEFRDTRGMGFAQPDVMLELEDSLLIFECKYTWVPEAEEKLRALYIPLAEALYGKPARGIVVCKKLRPGAPAACSELSSAAYEAWKGRPAVLHWLGGNYLDLKGLERAKNIATAKPRPQELVEILI